MLLLKSIKTNVCVGIYIFNILSHNEHEWSGGKMLLTSSHCNCMYHQLKARIKPPEGTGITQCV